MDKLEGMEIAEAPEEITRDSEEREVHDSPLSRETPSEDYGRGSTPVENNLETESSNSTDGEAVVAGASTSPIDYERVIREDLLELRSAFSELGDITPITELPNPMRYAALRDLGLTAREAYLATSEARAKDNRSHLSSAVPGGVGAPRSNMTRSELESARELFPGLRDGELIGLYKKVNL